MMILHRIHFVGARLLFTLFVLLTSIYCLLAYIPLTQQWVIKCTILTWLPIFAHLHPYLYWIAFAAVATTLRIDFHHSPLRRLVAGFVIYHIAVGFSLLYYPLLANLTDDYTSFIRSLLALFSLLWLALIDYTGYFKDARWSTHYKACPGLLTATLAAAFISLLYTAILQRRHAFRADFHFAPSEQAIALGWSFASHLLIFLSFLACCTLIRFVSHRFGQRDEIEFFLSQSLVVLLIALVVRKVIFTALLFNSLAADVFAVGVSFTVIASLSGLLIRITHFTERPLASSVGAWLRWLVPARLLAHPAVASLWLAGLAVLAFLLPASVSGMDWNGLLQKLSVFFIWLFTLAFFHALRSPHRRQRRWPVAALILPLAALSIYTTLRVSPALLPAMMKKEQFEVELLLERYRDFDLSFSVAHDILTPSADNEEFYAFLKENTNLPVTTPIKFSASSLAEESGASPESPRPHIFIIVVDSLRQDYLSPYNPAVTFTPRIAEFARESVVFQNAFTRYSGTILSEPSIWVGGTLPHKSYVEPIYSINALQRLIDAEKYRQFITVDPVLDLILRPSPEIQKLDNKTVWFNYDLRQTVKDLEDKIAVSPDPSRPIFVYTQPQNLHQTTVSPLRRRLRETGGDDNFDAAYASQVRRVDEAFGEFITYLKRSGIYDNSIIVLTADHGESLGEGGRWGHSYILSPQVMKIPLLFHLPSRYRDKLVSRPQQIAFSTDITPSLYYLLGRRPAAAGEVMGRPLFTATSQEQEADRQNSYLIACSYGPVYGILKGNGQSLFIADSVNRRDYFFDLGNDPKGTHNRLTPALSGEYEKLIRSELQRLNNFYDISPTQPHVASR